MSPPKIITGALGLWWGHSPPNALRNAIRLRDEREATSRALLAGRMRWEGGYVELAFGAKRTANSSILPYARGGEPPDLVMHFVASDDPIPRSVPGWVVEVGRSILVGAVVPEAGAGPIPHRIAYSSEVLTPEQAMQGHAISIKFCAEEDVRALRWEVWKAWH